MEVHDTVSAILKHKGGQVWSVSPEASVLEALTVMAKHEVGALLVLEGERAAGVVSERDYARKIVLKGRSSHDTAVGAIMNAPPITVSPDCSVDEAMRLMTENRIRHLPVIESDGKVVGLVSIGDLVKWIITSQGEMIEQLHSYIAGRL